MIYTAIQDLCDALVNLVLRLRASAVFYRVIRDLCNVFSRSCSKTSALTVFYRAIQDLCDALVNLVLRPQQCFTGPYVISVMFLVDLVLRPLHLLCSKGPSKISAMLL